ncbi:hypothetical protein Tco_0796724 [Tanacetum coccineum]
MLMASLQSLRLRGTTGNFLWVQCSNRNYQNFAMAAALCCQTKEMPSLVQLPDASKFYDWCSDVDVLLNNLSEHYFLNFNIRLRKTGILHQEHIPLKLLRKSTDNMIPPVFLSFYNNPCLKDVQAFYAKEFPISSPDPITPPAILTLSLILPPSLLFNPRYFFIPEELLLPRKQIHSPYSSSTTLFIHLGINL